LNTARAGRSVRQRRAAAELKRLRELALLTADEVAHRLGWSASKISRIENARIRLRTADLELLLDLYEVDGEQRDKLLALTEEDGSKKWWEAYADSLPQQLLTYISFEAEASTILTYDPMVIPGLLQTRDYAEQVIQMWQTVTSAPPVDWERRLDVRMIRQRIISSENPPQLNIVIDEAVLRRQIGARSVMQEQLQHLARVSTLANVDLRILPLSGLHFVYAGPLAILQVQDYGNVLYLETSLDANIYVEAESSTLVYHHKLYFDQLVKEALDQPRSRQLIKNIADELWEPETS
jgi:transcriptional regulator with XRE-family HTH domain